MEFHLQWSGAPKLGFNRAGELLSPEISPFPRGMSDFNNPLHGLSRVHEPLLIGCVRERHVLKQHLTEG